MRFMLALALLALGACGRGETQPQALEGAMAIDCALGEGSPFGRDCLVEKVAGEQGPEFVVRHPDGKFRRLRIAEDRAGIVAIDGADEAVNERVGDPAVLQVSVGADRYRFPANLDAQS
jgi:hypothetical protein